MIALQIGAGRLRFTFALGRLGLAVRTPFVGEMAWTRGIGLTFDRWRDVRGGKGLGVGVA
ncbi:hypothetical protein E2L08_13195 [Palleronia sediminis]|uniref:Uncharacterized protein n=1 Tax=Palleronia sediminis TaxID=2547833 RepID=A0A4R6A9K4_9RHOB|nr:hypothetical protein [Palleronia sediminis]TDL77733.1 hypothetical protein E2L08_13195 [Palleronia sediminis]